MVRVKGFAALPAPQTWMVDRALSGMVVTPDPRCAVQRYDPPPDTTVGVLTVPLKGYGYSSRFLCTECKCSPTDSHPGASDISAILNGLSQ